MTESINLEFKEGSSDKVYQAELKEEAGGFVVNFAYGRRGSTLTTGSKTAAPVDYDTAKKTYDKLVKSKTSKGYKPQGGEDLGIQVVDKNDTGIRPQLLNDIAEEDAEKYIIDDRWCMQEKFDGRRKMLHYSGSTVIGANKKGLEVPIITQMQLDVQRIQGACLLDGEDMGDTMKLFDMLSYPNMSYKARYEMLTQLVPNGAQSLHVVATAWTTNDKRDMFHNLKANKAEGVVFKLIDAPYSPGRPASGGAQLKCKFYETASCIVLTQSPVKSSISVGVLDEEGNTVNVGNVTVYANQVTPEVGSIVEVKYLYYYPNGSLYQPVLLGVRDDVDRDECLLYKLKTKKDSDD